MRRVRERYKEGNVAIPSGCAISGILNRKGKTFSGKEIIQSISLMRERSNGLGGGFAAYGIYPEYKDLFAFHMLYEDESCRIKTEEFLSRNYQIEKAELLPVNKIPSIKEPPIIWRYFLVPRKEVCEELHISLNEFVVRSVMEINAAIDGAFVASSGKNMGAFKGVGYPEDIGEFYRLEEYQGYLWTAHGRFPTNTPGWWGGAHPFTLLDWSVVHNGEISSYGTNARYLEEFGYECALKTDTEAAAYLFDLLIRCHGLPKRVACQVLAAPFWEHIERMPEKEREIARSLRIVYGKALLNGPFSILLGCSEGMIAINDRIKLRPLIAAEKDENLYVSSEESAIIEVCRNPDKIWVPRAGEPVIGILEGVERWASAC